MPSDLILNIPALQTTKTKAHYLFIYFFFQGVKNESVPVQLWKE